jgi:heme-degrading monooxygenase HmoA
MIARIWRGVVRVEDADVYLAYLHETGVRDYTATPGNLSVTILQRDVDQGVEFTALTFWESMDAIRAFAGDQPEVAHYYPDDDRYLIAKEPLVDHFEVPFSDLEFPPRKP